MIYPDYFTKEDIQEFEREYNAMLDAERDVAEKQQLVAIAVSEEIYSPYLGAI
jgi:hypothetical protein